MKCTAMLAPGIVNVVPTFLRIKSPTLCICLINCTHIHHAPCALLEQQKMWLQGGLQALWAGLKPSLVAAVPMVGIYMPLYEITRDAAEPHLGGVAPLVAGSLARAVAVCCVAPLEVLRTRLMSGHDTGDLRHRHHASQHSHAQPSAVSCAQAVTPRESMWSRGLSATVCS
jgi:hypothetical protein